MQTHKRSKKLANISKVSSKNNRNSRVHYLNNQLNLWIIPPGQANQDLDPCTLQESSKASNKTTNQDTKPIDMAHIERGHARTGASSSIDKGIDRGLRCSRGRLGGSSNINTLGILGSTGVLYSAVILATWVTIAIFDALVVGFRAGVVGDCLGKFAGIGDDVIVAYTVVE